MSDKITDKFELYDVLGILVPGLVAVGMIFAVLSWTGRKVEIPAMPDGLQVLVLSATAIVLGQTVQALGSLLEPFYFGRGVGDRVIERSKARVNKCPLFKQDFEETTHELHFGRR